MRQGCFVLIIFSAFRCLKASMQKAQTFSLLFLRYMQLPDGVFLLQLKTARRWMSVALFILTLGIWVSAIYLTHHYILDVAFRHCCAITGIAVLEKYLLKKTAVGTLLKRMEEKIV